MIVKLTQKLECGFGPWKEMFFENEHILNEMGGTLTTIAEDVNIQVEFNPREIKAYRLIGYESHQHANQNSGHNETASGELGAGHVVTALYELVPARSNENVPMSGKLKYQKTLSLELSLEP